MRAALTWWVSIALAVSAIGCGDDGDGAAIDAGEIDAGEVDAGQIDSGEIDAGQIDGGEIDAGARDAGLDAGDIADAGLDATPPDSGPVLCADALDVTNGVMLANQTTVGAGYDLGPTGTGCPGGGLGSGPEVEYVMRPATTTTYRVTVTPRTASYDPMLYVMRSCASENCIDGTVLEGAGDPETLTLTVNGGETAYLIVDGELASSGSFDLEVAIE